jgi:hypothetical protein
VEKVGLEFYCTLSGRENKMGKILWNNKMYVCSEMKGCVGGWKCFWDSSALR